MNKKWNWNQPITWKQSILGAIIYFAIYIIRVLIQFVYESGKLNTIRMRVVKGCQNVRTDVIRKWSNQQKD